MLWFSKYRAAISIVKTFQMNGQYIRLSKKKIEYGVRIQVKSKRKRKEKRIKNKEKREKNKEKRIKRKE